MGENPPIEDNNGEFQFVEVLRGSDEGFWEVDTIQKKALFRESTHTLPPGYMIHDWTEIHRTITDYLLATQLSPVHVKEIIPDRKYIFSSDPICSFYTVGAVASDPSKRLHCMATATVIQGGQPLCNMHAKVNF